MKTYPRARTMTQSRHVSPIVPFLIALSLTSFAPKNVFAQTVWAPRIFTFTASGTPSWLSFPLTATFTHSSGARVVVEGYWDGGKTWRVRFAPSLPGSWTWSTTSSDSGLGGKTGSFSAASPSSSQLSANSNLRGHLRIASDRRTFTRADGTPFFYLGDTGWFFGGAALANVQSWANDRKTKGFTVMQVMYADVKDGNEGGYPYTSSSGGTDNGNYSLINPGYFQALDNRMQYLFDRGFVVAGHPDWLTVSDRFYDLPKAQNLFRYLLARYGAYPLVLSVTGEYHLSKPYWAENNYARIRQLGAFVKTKNAYKHLLSVHPGGADGNSAVHFNSETWLDHNWLQTYTSPQNIPWSIQKAMTYIPTKPVIESEPQYDAIPGRTAPADLQRRQAWVALLSGAAGYVHGAFGIFQFTTMGNLALPGSFDVSRLAAFFKQNGIHLSALNPKVAAGKGCVTVNAADPNLLTQTHARCAGTSGVIYILYAPVGSSSHALVMRGLANFTYVARWFNPRTGALTLVNGGNPINTDLNDTWTVPGRPSGDDWVLWLSRAGTAASTPAGPSGLRIQ